MNLIVLATSILLVGSPTPDRPTRDQLAHLTDTFSQAWTNTCATEAKEWADVKSCVEIALLDLEIRYGQGKDAGYFEDYTVETGFDEKNKTVTVTIGFVIDKKVEGTGYSVTTVRKWEPK